MVSYTFSPRTTVPLRFKMRSFILRVSATAITAMILSALFTWGDLYLFHFDYYRNLHDPKAVAYCLLDFQVYLVLSVIFLAVSQIVYSVYAEGQDGNGSYLRVTKGTRILPVSRFNDTHKGDGIGIPVSIPAYSAGSGSDVEQPQFLYIKLEDEPSHFAVLGIWIK